MARTKGAGPSEARMIDAGALRAASITTLIHGFIVCATAHFETAEVSPAVTAIHGFAVLSPAYRLKL